MVVRSPPVDKKAMFSKLLKRRAVIKAPETPRVPEGEVVWAIGDIHGRLDLLTPLVEAIRADAMASDARKKSVVFLGDYIDRGPDSRGVIQFLAALPKSEGIAWRFLKGNHEEAMLDFLDNPTTGPTWCEYGGDATLKSYGLRTPQLKHRADGWAHLAADLDHKVMAHERKFLETLELSVGIGDYFFSHAGARPGEPLDRQTAEDLMWIRRSFLDSDVEFEQVVVHGHTPTAEVHADHRRVGIDTRAYESGVLTALRLSGTERRLMQTIRADGLATPSDISQAPASVRVGVGPLSGDGLSPGRAALS